VISSYDRILLEFLEILMKFSIDKIFVGNFLSVNEFIDNKNTNGFTDGKNVQNKLSTSFHRYFHRKFCNINRNTICNYFSDKTMTH
jgi:hypothetical protein